MKLILLVIFFSVMWLTSVAQKKELTTSVQDTIKKLLVVEAACGQCQLGLPGKSCDLAVRLKGKSYFVDGTTIDSHGDAHAQNGFCNAIRKANVQGEIVNNRFKATYFSLIPEVPKKSKAVKS